MSDRLRELLSKEPTKDEVDMAGDCGCGADYVAGLRTTLVRETMRECAKVMCDGCRRGQSLLQHPQFNGVWLHDNEGEVATECDAQEIQHLLAETETP